jgi:hypothetical protein
MHVHAAQIERDGFSSVGSNSAVFLNLSGIVDPLPKTISYILIF